MSTLRKFVGVASLLVALASGASAASVSESYPSKPIKAIVPFPAASATDGMARLISEKLSTSLGHGFIVMNVAGANGTIGARLAARAAPDGYTIFFGTNSTHSAATHLYKNPGYDPVKDFEPVALLSRTPLVLVVRADSKFRSFQDLINAAKESPGKLTYGVGNTGSLAAAQMIKTMAGVDLLQVSYRGTPQAVIDLLGGQIDFLISDLGPTREHIKAGTLRALAVTSKSRMTVLPDVPTIAESGLSDYELFSWNGVYAPAGTPAEIVTKLHRAIMDAVASPEGARFFGLIGAEPVAPLTPAEFGVFAAGETKKWGETLRAAGLEPQ